MKNKKGKKQQKMINMIAQQVYKEDPKKKALQQQQAKQEKKKKKETDALLGFLQKSLGTAKKEDKKAKEDMTEEEKIADDKIAKINIYVDPREPDPTRSPKICDAFLDACEKNVYGWQWTCPNGGIKCGYSHCLPEGYMLKSTMEALMRMQQEDDDDKALEYKIEEERAKLNVEK